MSVYAKSIVMVVTTALTAVAAALSDGRVSQVEAVNIVLAALGAAAVFAAPNVAGAAYTKAVLAVLVAAATALASVLGSGGVAAVTASEWLQVVLAGLGALSTLLWPNARPAGSLRAGAG